MDRQSPQVAAAAEGPTLVQTHAILAALHGISAADVLLWSLGVAREGDQRRRKPRGGFALHEYLQLVAARQ